MDGHTVFGMALIDPDSPAAKENSYQFWYNEYINTKTLLLEIEKAILKLTQKQINEYTIDTGQTRQTVKYNDLPALRSWQNQLLTTIATLEARLKIGGSRAVQVVPLWP